MFGKRYELFKLFGFPIRIDLSWLIIVVLITWSLATGLFPVMYEDLAVATYWIMGVVGTLGLFVSILLHELSHAKVAQRFGMPMRGITLFIFGGVAEMTDESPSAKAEFWVAIAGPIASILIAALCGGAYLLGRQLNGPAPVLGILAYLMWINGVLVAFNIIPAFPLDGGRVLRSILWKAKGSLRWATRITSQIGSGFGIALILLGVVSFIAGNFIGGMWWVLIGMFLRSAAQMSYRQLVIRRALEGESVRRFMQAGIVSVPSEITVQDLVEQYVYQHHYKLYPVVDDGTLRGCVSTRQIKDLPREQWPGTRVGDLAESCSDKNTIHPDADAMKALARMNERGVSRLLVVDHAGRLVGILALKDMLKFIALKVELEEDSSIALPPVRA